MIENAKQGLNVRVAAEVLGVTPQTINAWLRKGILPYTRFGPSIIRIDPEELIKLRQAYPTEVEGGKK